MKPKSGEWKCIACSIFKTELEALRKKGEFDMPVHYLDSMLHMEPGILQKKLDRSLGAESRKYKNILLLFGDCHAYMKDQTSPAGITRVKGINCPEIFLGPVRYRELRKQGHFFLLYEWALRWQEIFKSHLGLSPHVAKDLMADMHTKLLYLDTGVNPVPRHHLEELSEYTGLAWEVMKVDISGLRVAVEDVLPAWNKPIQLPVMQKRPPGFPEMALDILETLLKDADNPRALAAYLTAQLRELTGARTVILLQCLESLGGSGHRLVSVDPERRRGVAEKIANGELAELVHRQDRPRIWEQGLGLNGGLSMTFPLSVGADRVGNLLLLDLTEREHIEMVEEILRLLSTIVALVFRNSLLYEQQEEIIDRRTRELKESEQRLRQAQKMEAIGTMAGGISHDFNNILSAILGYTELACLELEDRPKVKKKLNHVLQAGQRARELVSRILTFSRSKEAERKPLQMNAVVDESLKLLRASLPSTIEIRFHRDPRTGTVVADPTQMQQVMMNLCTNASHAMKDRGGTLEISLRHFYPDDQFLNLHAGLQRGPYQQITVSDTGKGMDEQTLERIFDPFFTTKEPGEGTGIGLSMVHGIIVNHGGAIDVLSKPGKGTSITIYLPIGMGVIPAPVIDQPYLAPAPKGSGHILLVDDEIILADLGKEILENLGYRVTTDLSPQHALEVFRKNPGKFDLVFTDMTMPGMTGIQLAHNILSIRPEIPIILCTGFSTKINEQSVRKLGVKHLLHKPMEPGLMGHAVRQALEESRNSPEA